MERPRRKNSQQQDSQESDSPLYLKPIYDNGETFIGYKLRSTKHKEDDEWILDIVKDRNDPNVEIDLKNKTIILKNPSKRKEIFLRDCCFLCENIFFAKGKGIDIDKEILDILKRAQPNKNGINSYAIFGLSENGSADGLTGSYLEIGGELAKKLIIILTKKAKKIAHPRGSLKENTIYRGKY